MRRLCVTAMTIAAIALVTTGCPPEDDDPSSSDPYADIEDESLGPVLIQESMCEVGWQCPDANAATLDSLRFWNARRHLSESDCVAHIREIGADYESGTQSPERELAKEKGRISIQRSYMQECKSAIVDALCTAEADSDFIGDDPDHPCHQLFLGSVEEGGHCNLSDECQGNLSCDTDHEDTADECYGVCVTDDDDCGGESCGADEFCDESMGTQSCTARLSAGETCESSDHCEFGLWCHEVDEECSEIEILSEGENCNLEADLCQAGTYCSSMDSEEATCRAHSGEGDECQENAQCVVGLSCHTDEEEETSQCAPIEEGSPCEYNYQCPDETQCDADSKTCEPLGDVGDECNSRLECKSDYCHRESFGEPGECTERLPIGEECEQDGACESGHCDAPNFGEPGECAESEEPEEEICYLPGDEN